MNSRADQPAGLQAGAATVDITPPASVFLFGYPHVPRLSTGVHDALTSTALCLKHETGALIFVAHDLIFVGKKLANDVRAQLSERTGIPVKAIVLTATHTHSGPVTVNYVSNAHDAVVPPADEKYLAWLAERMVEAGVAAFERAVPAEVGLAIAQADGVGTNRHDVNGPADPEVPVLMVRARDGHRPLACMVVYAMHPTVLHEDSRLVSGDFPDFTRKWLRQGALPADCPVLYHNGASGNQSPRHVTKANTMAEAQRLGERLGRAIADAITRVEFRRDVTLSASRTLLDLELREFGSYHEAQRAAESARARLDRLRAEGASRQAIRTAECDWFGADETVALTLAAASGKLQAAAQTCMPAEISVLRVGPWKFVCWPGEFFVEFALEVRAASSSTFVITMANGELQGYIVTSAAAAAGVYEATNAVFSPKNGERVVKATAELLRGNS